MNGAKLLVLMGCVVGATMFMSATGIAGELGGQPNTGVEDDYEDLEESARNLESDQRGVSSIIGLAISSVSLGAELFTVGLAAPVVLNNMGIPMPIATALSLPVYALYVILGLTIMRGVGIL